MATPATDSPNQNLGETWAPEDITDAYEIGETLGTGHFSKVKLGTDKKTGMKVAIKVRRRPWRAESARIGPPACNGVCFGASHHPRLWAAVGAKGRLRLSAALSVFVVASPGAEFRLAWSLPRRQPATVACRGLTRTCPPKST